MVKSKRAQQLLDARNNKAENQRNKKKDDELRAEESREIEEWRIQQECVPKAMVMVETKKFQDLVNHFDCRKCGRKGKFISYK